MGFVLLLFAATLSGVGAFFHGVIGARIYMSKINNSNLEKLSKSLSFVSWHMFTLLLVTGAAAFLLVAAKLLPVLGVYPFIAINALGALLFIVLSLRNHRELIKMPGAYLMAVTAICGYLGTVWLN